MVRRKKSRKRCRPNSMAATARVIFLVTKVSPRIGLSCSGESHLNIGTGEDITIAGLAGVVAEVIGYRGELVFDPSRPDGPPQKLLDVSRLSALGWKAHTPLRVGLERSHADFLARAEEHGSGKVGRI